MAEILKGAPVASAIARDLTKRVEALKEKGVIPSLYIIRTGDNPEDVSYQKAAVNRCSKIGISVNTIWMPPSASKEEFLDPIHMVNDNPTVHGCLLMRPAPNREFEEAACLLLNPAKDMDGMTPGSMAKVYGGIGEGYPPCTAEACLAILDHYGITLEGKTAVVLGRSPVIGKPVSMMLQERNATVTMCHSKTPGLENTCRSADILVTAIGKPESLHCGYISCGQIILDVGINVMTDGRVCGDIDYNSVEVFAGAITPVPGGVGAVTTAILAKHVVEAAEKALRG